MQSKFCHHKSVSYEGTLATPIELKKKKTQEIRKRIGAYFARSRRVEATRKFLRSSSLSSYFKKLASLLTTLGDGFEDRQDPYQEMQRGNRKRDKLQSISIFYLLSFLSFLLLLLLHLFLLLPLRELPPPETRVSRNDSSFVTNRCGLDKRNCFDRGLRGN